MATPGLAIPTLQLDILDGVFDLDTETITASGSTFTLLALLTPQNNSSQAEIDALLGNEYFVSAALAPQVGPGHTDLGSFTFDDTTVQATADMMYGVPPIDPVDQGHDPGDLPKHGIFETYFSQFSFQFSPGNTTTPYNTYDNPGGSLLAPGGTGAYYAQFNVSAAALAPGSQLHFDLYGAEPQSPDIDITLFAPMSHHAGTQQVPEPGTSFLLASGVLLLLARRRRRR